MDVRSLYGLALDVTTLAVLRLVKCYPASGEELPEDRNSVELVLWEVKDMFERFELGGLVDEEEFLEACFEVLRLPGVPVRVGRRAEGPVSRPCGRCSRTRTPRYSSSPRTGWTGSKT